VRVDSEGVRKRILEVLAANPGGLPTWEIADIMGVPRDYISPHLQPLSRANRVKLSGSTKVNPDTGRSTQVWTLIT